MKKKFGKVDSRDFQLMMKWHREMIKILKDLDIELAAIEGSKRYKIEEQMPLQKKPAETGQEGTINVNILGDVQARNLQIGQGGSIHYQPITDNKSKGHFGTILEIIGVIINFLKSVFWHK